MATKNANGAALSIRPSNFAKGTGLIDDVDALIKEARWVIWDYNGKSAQVTAAKVTYLVEDSDGNTEEYPSYYSIGKEGSASFIPAKDGKTLTQIGTKDALAEGCNFFQFISSVVNAGYDENLIEGTDISFLDNWYVHVKREAQPDRQGLAKVEGEREKTTLCIARIISQDGKPGKGGKAAGKVAAGKPAAGKANGSAVAVDEELESTTVDAILTALGATDSGSLTKVQLGQKLFQALKGNPHQAKASKLAFNDEFLSAEGRMWTFDGTTVSMG